MSANRFVILVETLDADSAVCPNPYPSKQYKPVADLKVREQRMEWPAHANPVDQWGEQFAELPMMVA